MDEKIAQPILLGNELRIRERAVALRINLSHAELIDPQRSAMRPVMSRSSMNSAIARD